MAAQYYKINYKSDFVLTINSDAGWAVPFCIKFWTGMPSHGYFAGFDGENYVNCRVGDTPTQLLVMFDDHHMPIGPLRMQIAYHTTIEEFPDRKFDEVTNPTNVTVDIDGTEYQVMLDFTGETGAEIDFSMPSSGVMSVNGKIGYVTLNAEDVGAQPTIEDLATIRSGAAAGATAVQPNEMTAALATKQDTISDLATIRSGAAAGATAVQPAAITPIQTALQTIEAVIPSAASSQNQLADKNFVNSSIATNTANFVGTYNSLAELQAVQNPTNNDYGFVIETDAQGNEYYDRYKYVAASQQWLFEYKVESTPFTAAQWAAIQSGITSALVTKLNALPTNAELQQTLDGKANTSDIPTALSQLSQDSTHRVVTDAEKSTWNGKQNAIDDLATIRSGAAAGATAVQPAAMNTALAAKQDTLTFDNTPTANSSNPVKSSGIKTALDAKQSTISTVNVTVDNNTGTPSGSASVSGSTLSLSFQNLKGATGATGATGPQGPQGERGLPGESGVTGDVSGFTVIQTIDPSATYGATDIAGAATVQATNAELTELAGELTTTTLTQLEITKLYYATVRYTDRKVLSVSSAYFVASLLIDSSYEKIVIKSTDGISYTNIQGIFIFSSVPAVGDTGDSRLDYTAFANSGNSVEKTVIVEPSMVGKYLVISSHNNCNLQVFNETQDNRLDALEERIEEHEQEISQNAQDIENLSNTLGSEIEQVDEKYGMALKVDDITSAISSSFVSGKYPQYNNGFVNTASSGNPVGYYIIPLSSLQRYYSIKAFLEADGTISAAIAFYSSEDTFTTGTYIGGVQHKNTTGDWFESQIPVNAKACLITNRHIAGHDTPIVFALRNDEGIVKDIINAAGSNEYTEELIGSVTLAESATTGELAIGETLRQGDIIKVIIPAECPRTYVGSARYQGDLCSTLNEGQFYIPLIKPVDKLYFYRLGSTAQQGTISAYRCTKKSDYKYSPLMKSFFKYKNPQTITNWNVGKQWLYTTNAMSNSVTDACTGLIKMYRPHLRITLADTTNYKFYITKYDNAVILPNILGMDMGWQTTFDEVLDGCQFAITLRKNTGNMSAADLSVITVEVTEPFVDYYITEEEVKEKINEIGSINNKPDVLKPYIYHFAPNSFIRDGEGHPVIPSQTYADIIIATRLGFSFIEANVQATSDGHFICMHGESGKFGSSVYSLDNTDISNVLINTKTLAWIKQNVRFSSYYDKYKVSPLSLEEFCGCCKSNGIGVLAGTGNANAISICLRIMGTDDLILYNAGAANRQNFKGMMFYWTNSTLETVSSILATARSHGLPFMFCLGPDLLAEFISNSQLENLCEQMHAEGFTVSSTAVYDTEENIRYAFAAGVDYSGSGHQVNPFEPNYETYDLDGDSSQFGGTATISNGVATLVTNSTVICGSDTVIPLGKGMLVIRFNGSLTISFGSVGDRTVTSDGSKDIVISDYFYKRKTKLLITANSGTTIDYLSYKTSKC